MYTAILATVLSTAAAPTQQWGGWGGWGYGGCYGCYGCYGGGWGCGGCYGCYGGGWGCGGWGGWGCGGCWGYGGWGWGGGWGGWGGGWGCYGCWGGYAAYGVSAPYLAYSAYGPYGFPGCVGCGGGCYGCYGGWSCYGSPIVVTPPAAPPNRKAPSEDVAPPKGDKKEDKKGIFNPDVSNAGSWATIVMQVPVDAKVFIDGVQMKSTSARRVYQTPMLEEGETYFYDIRVELVRDGRTYAETRRVIINPGQRIAANFNELGAAPPAALAQLDEE
jgi:uncharacterized protein (TIGR03000 family)